MKNDTLALIFAVIGAASILSVQLDDALDRAARTSEAERLHLSQALERTTEAARMASVAAAQVAVAAHQTAEAARQCVETGSRVAELIEVMRLNGVAKIEVREITVTTTAAKLAPASGHRYSTVSCVAEDTSQEWCAGHPAVTTDTGACFSSSSPRGEVMSMDSAEVYAVAGGSYVIDCVFGLD